MVARLTLRALHLDDAEAVFALYRAVAASPESGLARRPDELSLDYVAGNIAKALNGGVALGAFREGRMVGVIRALPIGPRQFAHVLTDLTVAVDPAAQGQGIGAALFSALFEATTALGITRVELMTRSGNGRAIALYEKLGFVREGCFKGRVRLPDGRIEDDIAMARLA
jgi:RimJ/RimL family protein N-acetyltransferase